MQLDSILPLLVIAHVFEAPCTHLITFVKALSAAPPQLFGQSIAASLWAK